MSELGKSMFDGKNGGNVVLRDVGIERRKKGLGTVNYLSPFQLS